MSMIDGPGGVGGPKGPQGPDGSPEVGDVDGVPGDAPIEQAHGAAPTGDVEALAAEVAAGRLTQQEAIDHLLDRLVAATAGSGLDAAARAELRELLVDLVTNDPYLGNLAGRI